MGATAFVDRLAGWLRDVAETKCSRMKRPSALADDVAYEYTLAAPRVFVHAYDNLDAIEDCVPSVLLTVDGATYGRDHAAYAVTLVFAAWDSGTHGEDVFTPDPARPGVFVRGGPGPYVKGNQVRTDLLNMVDFFVRELRSGTGLPYGEPDDIRVEVVGDDELQLGGFAFARCHCEFREPLAATGTAKQAEDATLAGLL